MDKRLENIAGAISTFVTMFSNIQNSNHQNTSLTWGDDQNYPSFTNCFIDCGLLWVPCGWLWLTSPFYIYYLFFQTSVILRRSRRNLTKLALALIQLIITVLELIFRIKELIQTDEHFFQTQIIGPLVEVLTTILVIFYIKKEHQKGVVASGVLFVYWVLAFIVHNVPLYIKVIEQGYIMEKLDFVLFILTYVLIFVQLILNCFAETSPVTDERKKSCPELRSSFLSRITFHWIQNLVVTGYRKPLTEDDIFSLNTRDQSETVVKAFERNWKLQEIRQQNIYNKSKHEKQDSNCAVSTPTDQNHVTETTPLHDLNTCNQHPCDSDAKNSSVEAKNSTVEAKNSTPRISLLSVLFKTFGVDLLISHFWKLCYDVLMFVNPFLLQLLIEFTEDKRQPVWKGYVYSMAFFVVIVLQSFFFNVQMQQASVISFRVRSALITAVFKKSLTMSNRSRAKSTAGEIVNLMSVDTEKIQETVLYLWETWSFPLQIIACMVCLYYTVGNAMFAGLGILIVMLPVSALIFNKIVQFEDVFMKTIDERIKLTTEVLNGIKILKLYAWEMAFGSKISDIRNKELSTLIKRESLYCVAVFSWTVAPFMIGLSTYATYIYTSDDHRFDAKTAFVAMALFNILRVGLIIAPITAIFVVRTCVSIRRLEKYLNNPDIDRNNVTHKASENAITVEDGSFSWIPEQGTCLNNINMTIPKGGLVAIVGSVGAGKSSLVSAFLGEMEKLRGRVNIDGTIAYVPQQAWIQNATLKDNIIFGQQINSKRYDGVIDACALKSDFEVLQAGDRTEIGEKGINLSGGQKQRVSLARAVYFDSDIYLLDDPLSAVDSHVGKHIFDEVIGRNGLLKDKTRVLVTHGIHWLQHVDKIYVITDGRISECGSYDDLLNHDGAFAKFLRNFLVDHGQTDVEDDDDDEVQEMTAALKRLSSIQSDDSSQMENCLHRQRSPTVPESENIYPDIHVGAYKRQISAMSDKGSDLENIYPDNHVGAFKRQISTMFEKTSDLENIHAGNHIGVFKREISVLSDTSRFSEENAKLIDVEEVEVGSVHWSVFLSYAKAVGIKSFLGILLLFGLAQFSAVWSRFWLTDWTSDVNLQNLTYWPGNSTERREKNDYYLGIYGVFGFAQGCFVIANSLALAFRCIAAAKFFHKQMLDSILRAPMSFFDTTPQGRIVNRLSQDVEAIDTSLPHMLMEVLTSFYRILSTIIVISYSTPFFMTVIIPVGIIYFILQRFYIPTGRQLKRLASKTRSPIFSNFSETLNGVSVIRAFHVEKRFIDESEAKVDYNIQHVFAGRTVNRWLGLRLELLGAVIVFAASMFTVVTRDTISGAVVGLSVSYALQITDSLNWFVFVICEMETKIVSVERVRQYTETPSEAALHTDCQVDRCWPKRGHVQLESYSSRYRDGLDLVLKDISLSIKPGEKVGIVGRTGAGKSSLTLSLFRLIEPSSGRILIDGQDVSHLGLFDLRSRLTILPQEPVMFSGSLRLNLDPINEQDDSAIWTALELAHLKSFVEDLPTMLEYEVGEGGQNLSVGQRQLICLARSLLRKSKILVLDEATAAVDLKTDSLIQSTISTEFKDCTVLTIAHRLNTVIDYDRILVLSNGEVKEFDSPKSLLQDSSSMFYSMAKDAGLIKF